MSYEPDIDRVEYPYLRGDRVMVGDAPAVVMGSWFYPSSGKRTVQVRFTGHTVFSFADPHLPVAAVRVAGEQTP